jgi:small-conductance mechanosensitive channel/CRP-like cAMP-binding protein
MNNIPSQSPFYLDLLVLLAAFGVAVVIYVFWRRLLGKIKPAGGAPAVGLVSQISLPAIFLLVALALKWDVVRNALSLGPKFALYIDAAVVFLAVLLLICLIDAWILFRYERRKKPFPMPGVLHGFLRIVLYLLVLFAVLKGMLGLNITPLLATSAIFTAIIGLAFQGVLSNLLAGISLNLTMSFGRGDWVKIGAHEGVVLDTNWRETLVFDRASNVVVIPNNTVASEMIVNFSRPDKKTALTIPLKVSAGAPPAIVLDALREAAREVPDVLTTPAPQAYILSYEDLGISYLVKYWVTDFARKHMINGDVARHIWYKFRRRGIEIPVELAERVKDVVGAVRPPEKENAQALELERTTEDLLHSGLLRYAEGEKAGELIVTADEVREMAAAVRRKKYTGGEVLFRQGEKGDSCFIVAKGMIRGEVIYEEEGKRYTSEFKIGPGGIFGEMSLFTGLPRTATGAVEEEAELLEITAEDFAGMLARNPKLAEVIADIVSARNRQNAEFLRKIKELSEKDIETGTNPHSILDRLKKLVARFRRSE